MIILSYWCYAALPILPEDVATNYFNLGGDGTAPPGMLPPLPMMPPPPRPHQQAPQAPPPRLMMPPPHHPAASRGPPPPGSELFIHSENIIIVLYPRTYIKSALNSYR